MKNLVIALLAVCLFTSATMAVEAKGALQVTGRVDSISPIDPDMGADEGSIEVIDAAGSPVSTTINSDTIFQSALPDKIDSHDISDGDMVTIDYLKTNKGNIAKVVVKNKKSAGNVGR